MGINQHSNLDKVILWCSLNKQTKFLKTEQNEKCAFNDKNGVSWEYLFLLKPLNCIAKCLISNTINSNDMK